MSKASIKRYKAKAREKAELRKVARKTFPVIKPNEGGNANRTEEETALERAKTKTRVRRHKRNPDGQTISYDVFGLEVKAIPEKPNKTKFERPRKRFKMYGRD